MRTLLIPMIVAAIGVGGCATDPSPEAQATVANRAATVTVRCAFDQGTTELAWVELSLDLGARTRLD